MEEEISKEFQQENKANNAYFQKLSLTFQCPVSTNLSYESNCNLSLRERSGSQILHILHITVGKLTLKYHMVHGDLSNETGLQLTLHPAHNRSLTTSRLVHALFSKMCPLTKHLHFTAIVKHYKFLNTYCKFL